MPPLLEMESVTGGYGKTMVLRDVSVRVSPGEIVALIGANGAGKSTLLNTIMRSIIPSSGQIRFDSGPLPATTAAIVRSGIALVPERRQLFGAMTVAENLRLGAYSRGDRAEIGRSLEAQFDAFPILRERRAQNARTLSGGEQQMLAMARGMMSRPRLLLLDEPSLGLAPMMVRRIFAQILALRQGGTTLLLVEQNSRAALGIADRGYVLEQGRIVLEGTSKALFDNSAVQDAYLGGDGTAANAIEDRVRARRALHRSRS